MVLVVVYVLGDDWVVWVVGVVVLCVDFDVVVVWVV